MSLTRLLAFLPVVTLMLAAPAVAAADIVFWFSPGAVQPEENVEFNEPGLVAEGTTVTGATNQSATVVEIEGSEILVTPSAGQARAEAKDGGFEWARLDLMRPDLFFTEFEANLNLLDDTAVTLTAADNFGHEYSTSFSGDGGGENFFAVSVVSDQLIDWIEIRVSGENTQDLRQIRIGGIQTEDGVPVVPEPGALMLLGAGLIGAAFGLRRKN